MKLLDVTNFLTFKKAPFIGGLFFVLVSFQAMAGIPLWVSAGTLTHNFLSAQNDATGGRVKFSPTPVVLGGVDLPFGSGRDFALGMGLAFFSTKDNTSKKEIILQYHIVSKFNSFFNLKYGFSNYLTMIGGDGSTVTLNNGNSTANFYAPSTTSTSYTASIDIAPQFKLTSSMSLITQFSILRFLSSDRRRVSHLILLNYNF